MNRLQSLIRAAALSGMIASPLGAWAQVVDPPPDVVPPDFAAVTPPCADTFAAVVDFGGPSPGTAQTHALNDTSVRAGGTVTFNIKGGGHRPTIYPVSANTTRADIDPVLDLCLTNACTIFGGNGDTVVEVPGSATGLINYALNRYAFTSGAQTNLSSVQVTFERPGRYLVLCATRGHLVDAVVAGARTGVYMYGFINVVNPGVRLGNCADLTVPTVHSTTP